MLSPGLHHQDIPRNLRKNLAWRRDLLKAAENDSSLQKGFWEICKQDFFFYIDGFVWQYNPMKPGREIEPFRTWDFQREVFRKLLDCLECHCGEVNGVHQHDMLWEKSREMGATWMFLLAADWLARFHRNKQLLMISKSADAVDSESRDSLFGKLRFVQKHLPEWLQGNIKDRYLYLGYEHTGSQIVGEASTGRAGVSARSAAMFIDEFSQIREDYEVLHRTSDTTGCRIFNGTHLGQGTAFYELSQRPDMRKVQMHWSEHPRKRKGIYELRQGKVEVLDKQYSYPGSFRFVMDGSPLGGPAPGLRSPWYDDACKRKGSSRAVAMDLDIDPQGSASLFFDRPTIHRLKQSCTPPLWEGEIDYDKQKGEFKSWKPRQGGTLKLWLHLTAEGRVPRDIYGLGCDLSTGSGFSCTCVSIVSGTTGLKVLEVADPHLDQWACAGLVKVLCGLFISDADDGPMVAWEMQGPGGLFSRRLMDDLGYRRVYYRQETLKTNTGNIFFGADSKRPGFHPDPTSKRLLLEEYGAALRLGQFMNKSEAALNETLSFSYDGKGDLAFSGLGNDDPSGALKNHGDRVISDALAWRMVKGHVLRRDLPPERKQADPSTLAYRRELHQQRQAALESWG